MPCPAVAPRRTRRTILKFAQLPKLSFSGAADDLPLALIEAKSGDSFNLRRMYIDIPTRMIDSRNGTRQPHELNCAGVTIFLTARITPSEMNRPAVAVI